MKKHFFALFIGVICGTLAFSMIQILSVTNKSDRIQADFDNIFWPALSTVIGFSMSEFISTKLE